MFMFVLVFVFVYIDAVSMDKLRHVSYSTHLYRHVCTCMSWVIRWESLWCCCVPLDFVMN